MQLSEKHRRNLDWQITTKKTFLNCGIKMVGSVELRRIDIVAAHEIKHKMKEPGF